MSSAAWAMHGNTADAAAFLEYAVFITRLNNSAALACFPVEF
jgi:hypothetical protein